jgi:hypothetical protein
MFPAIALICLLLHTAVMQDCKTSGEQVSANFSHCSFFSFHEARRKA